MAKIPLIMDFISGLLLAYDFLPKSGSLQQFHDGLRKRLEQINTNQPYRIGTIIFNTVVSCFMFFLISCWVFYKNRNAPPDTHLPEEILFLFIGSVIALICLSVVTVIFRNETKIWIASWLLIIIPVVLFLTVHPSVNFLAGLIAAIYMFLLFPFVTISANYIKRGLLAHPEKKFYLFAVLGLILFLASKLIQISSDP